MDNIPRFAFYTSGIFIVSAAFTLLTTELLPKIGDPTWTGTAFFIGFGLVYMNIIFVCSRRFMRREDGASPVPVIFAVLVAIPPIIWVFIYDAGLSSTVQIIYAISIIFACGLGAYFGHRAGIKAQARFQEQLREYLERDGKLPDDLKRPHDNLNKN